MTGGLHMRPGRQRRRTHFRSVVLMALATACALALPSLLPADTFPSRYLDGASSLAGEKAALVDTPAERRERALSRDAARTPLPAPSSAEAVREKVRAYRSANQRLEQQATRRATDLWRATRWVRPLASYSVTATFGASSGLWSNTHTGVDFAAASGEPISSVASGEVVEAGWAGAYGYRTIVRTQTGEELWYCHQSSISVTAGDAVASGEQIGLVGATGNVTGPHLHLEVRPGGGEPIDPQQALRDNGVQP